MKAFVITALVLCVVGFSVGTFIDSEIKKSDKREKELEADLARMDRVVHPKLPEHKLVASTCIRATTSEGNDFEQARYRYGVIQAIGEHDYQVEFISDNGRMWEEVIAQSVFERRTWIKPINCDEMESQVEAAIKGNGY